MNSLYIDSSWQSLNKFGETLCGDRVQIIRRDGAMVMVLADGLGSGVKANILSTLTSKIISTMMAEKMSIEQCVSAIANTLPVCEERKIAYSTFTIIRVDKNMQAHIIDYDNPHTIVLRNGKNFNYQRSISEINSKPIYQSKLQLAENDVLVSMSDGALYASDNQFFDMKNWTRDNIIEYLEKIYSDDCTAQALQASLLDKINTLYGKRPADDTTVSVLKARKRKNVDIVVGPPLDREDDELMLSLFFSKRGEKIVCGGTTAKIVAKYLDKPIEPIEPTGLESDIPPMSKIEGVSIVSEGIVTLNRVLQYAQQQLNAPQPVAEYTAKSDAASLISEILLDKATDINFFVGKAVNNAHKNDEEFVEFGIKQNLVDRLCQTLTQLNKQVKIYKF